jgi:hypothetical protein
MLHPLLSKEATAASPIELGREEVPPFIVITPLD